MQFSHLSVVSSKSMVGVVVDVLMYVCCELFIYWIPPSHLEQGGSTFGSDTYVYGWVGLRSEIL